MIDSRFAWKISLGEYLHWLFKSRGLVNPNPDSKMPQQSIHHLSLRCQLTATIVLQAVIALASLYLKYRLPVSMDVHDTLSPLHHALSTRYFDTLVFEAANTELAWFIPPHCSGWTCALHGCLPSVLEPHYCPIANTYKAIIYFIVLFEYFNF